MIDLLNRIFCNMKSYFIGIDHMSKSVSALDVAEYICEKFKNISPNLTAMKLQKLVYYCQVWSLVWNEEPIFYEEIQAWANGPIIKELYDKHRGSFYIDSISGGNSYKLDETQKDTIDRVISAYGDKTAQWLSELTHLENPWKDARGGLDEGDRGSCTISLSSLHEYYSGLDERNNLLE